MDEGTKDKWYLTLNYSETKDIIREKLQNTSRDFVAIGYYLKWIRDNELYKQDGYSSIWEFAEDNYGIKRTTASRWMAMNDKFSEGGNTPILAEEFRMFGKSQLQEMLYLDDKQMEEVSPDMTVQEIREVRNPEPEEEPVSILGYPLRAYPEDSLIKTPGCGKQDCFSCHRDGCELRQVDCYCVEAPMGNPFPCTNLNIVENLRQDVGTKCQFVNEDLAFHRAGDGQPVPCCKKCNHPCEHECIRSVRARHEVAKKNMCDIAHESEEQIPGQMSVEYYPELLPEETESNIDNDSNVDNVVDEQPETVIDTEYKEVAAENAEIDGMRCQKAADLDELTFSQIAIRDYLEEEERTLAEYEKVNSEDGGLPYNLMMRQRMLVKALRLLLESEAELEEDDELEEQEEPSPVQSDLPVMRNNDQRKEWLKNYKDWPVWFEVPEASEIYYRFNLPNGSSIVICEYHMWLSWKEKYSDENPDSIGTREYLLNPGYRYLQDCCTNSTALVEFLKNLQKGEKK